MRTILIYILLINSTLALAQSDSDRFRDIFGVYGQKHHYNSIGFLDTLTSNFIDSLKKERIDTICIYWNSYYLAYPKWPGTDETGCSFDGYFYRVLLFWKKNNTSYCTQKNNCFDYSISEVHTTGFWESALSDINTLKSETILPFQSINSSGDTSESFTFHDHSNEIILLVGADSIRYYFSDYQLSHGDNHSKNINFQHNQLTKIRQFQLKMDIEIETGIKNETLRKTKRTSSSN